MEHEFNLLTEPWIKVLTPGKTVCEVGLKELFKKAQHFTGLSGETKTQDFAVLRILLAIVYTVFSRYDVSGNEIDNEDEEFDPVDQWETIFEQGYFPIEPFEKYFEKMQERFWLFDEKYPFMQCNAVKGKGNPISTAKLIGSLYESNNKPRWFSDRNEGGRILEYAEAARWLLHIISFDDIAAKQPTPKKAWASKLGLVAIKGDNLFQTLMLNYIADADGEHMSSPFWEEEQNNVFNRLIAVPNNQAALLSLNSRKVYLCRENGKVNSYYLAGGDYFEEEDLPQEKMTLWRQNKEAKDDMGRFKPARHIPAKKAWHEFGAITSCYKADMQDDTSRGIRMPGVVKWSWQKTKILNVEMGAVIYDLAQATSIPVIDAISDNLIFHSGILSDKDDALLWRYAIYEEVEKCEDVAKKISALSINLQKAAGASGDKLTGNDARMVFYDRIDKPFRSWISSMDPDGVSNLTDKKAEIENKVYVIARDIANELVGRTGISAIFASKVGEDSAISSAQALNIFIAQVKKILNVESVGDEVEQK